MRRKLLAALPAVIIMCLIFYFSSFEAAESSDSSMSLSYRLIEAADFISGWQLTPEEAELLAKAIEGPIRKLAHVTEYALLAAAVFHMFAAWFNEGRKIFISTFIFSVLYAISDEVHQLFIKGRSGQFSDVCVDSVGIAIGALLFLYLYEKKKKKINL